MKLKNKNAISLIVLVITVIVLSILAATVIISLSNTNIISEANDAVKKANEQQIEEAKNLMYVDGMLGKSPEDMVIGDTTLIWDEESQTVIEKTTKDNNTYINKVLIPEGFYYVGGSKDSGLVISDNSADENKGVEYTCAGNQFVWIPVDDYSKFVRGLAEETSSGSGIYKMTGDPSSEIMNNETHVYTEPYASASATEKTEYSVMCASVEKYGGFYIARFEAGDGSASEARTRDSSTGTVVSKKNTYVYNYVSSNDAQTLSRGYLNNEFVGSTLCYGVQWDAIMNFVSDASHNIVNSSSWRNNGDIQKCGSNEAWKAKNIYDLAGNVAEWNMEWCERYQNGSLSGSYRVRRGGYYNSGGAAYRDYEFPVYESDNIYGFRVALYLK